MTARLTAAAIGALASACTCGTTLVHHTDYDAGPPGPVCGDGVIDGTEQCDGSNLGGQTCQSMGFIGGVLACSPSCQFDTTQCSRLCGNGQCDPLEECDGTNLCGAACADWGVYTCDATCHLVKTACVTTLFTTSTQASLLHPPILRFGKSITAARDDLAAAIPAGDPGPVVEIDRYDPTQILVRDRTLGLSAGFSPPFVYQDVTGDGYTDALMASAPAPDAGAPLGSDVLLEWWDATNGRFQAIDTPLGCPIDEYALGDLNEDGKPDIVVACGSPAQRIGVLASGQATPFASATWLSVNEPIEGIQVVDANGDAHLDIVFRRVGTNALGVLSGDGKLNFATLADAAVGSVVGPPHLVDFDLDGKLDLAVVDAANLKIHLYPGTGTLTFGAVVDIGTIGTPIEPRFVDLDLDGLPDISFASQPGSVAALKNLGTSGPARFNFRRQDTPITGMTFTTFDVGDLNGDGDMDAAVGGTVSGGAGQIVVLLGNIH